MSAVPKNIASNYYTATVTATYSDGTTAAFTGLGDIDIQWQRPVTLIKSMSNSEPSIAFGKLQGKVVLAGFAANSISGVAATSNISAWSAPATATVTLSTVGADATGTTSYTGFHTGDGFKFRKMTERLWVMDGTTTITL